MGDFYAIPKGHAIDLYSKGKPSKRDHKAECLIVSLDEANCGIHRLIVIVLHVLS